MHGRQMWMSFYEVTCVCNDTNSILPDLTVNQQQIEVIYEGAFIFSISM